MHLRIADPSGNNPLEFLLADSLTVAEAADIAAAGHHFHGVFSLGVRDVVLPRHETELTTDEDGQPIRVPKPLEDYGFYQETDDGDVQLPVRLVEVGVANR